MSTTSGENSIKMPTKREKVPTNLLRINGDVSEHFRLQLVEGHV